MQAIISKLVTPLTILIEAYRIFNGTLLVIFVPGVCGEKACLPSQNFENGSMLYRVNCGVNAATLLVFLMLYAVEIRREYKISHYLRVNPELPSDALTLKAAFEKLSEERQKKIHLFDRQYHGIIIVTIVMFLVNTILSGYVIITQYGNDKGPTLFATGTVLIASKIYNILTVKSKEGYTSAYLQGRLQFNDVNPGSVSETVV
jgi:cytochrome b subunit of formate dehydrogenase